MSRDLLGVPRVRVADPESGTNAESGTSTETGSNSGDGTNTETGSNSGDGTTDRATAPGGGGGTTVDVPPWLDKVKDVIPVEVVTAWAAIEGFIGHGSIQPTPYLALVVGMAVVTAAHMWVDVRTPTKALAKRLDVPLSYLRTSRLVQVALATLAFCVWAYYLGGLYGRAVPGPRVYYPTVAKVLLPLYVVTGPQLVPSLLRKLYGVTEPKSG